MTETEIRVEFVIGCWLRAKIQNTKRRKKEKEKQEAFNSQITFNKQPKPTHPLEILISGFYWHPQHVLLT